MREYQRAGRIRFIGFSTHGMTPLIVKAIETGIFDYVNLCVCLLCCTIPYGGTRKRRPPASQRLHIHEDAQPTPTTESNPPKQIKKRRHWHFIGSYTSSASSDDPDSPMGGNLAAVRAARRHEYVVINTSRAVKLGAVAPRSLPLSKASSTCQL